MTLGIGIIGLASYYSHYYAGRVAERSNYELEGAARVAATDDQLEALGRLPPAEFAEEYGCRVHESVDDLLAVDAVDAVVVVSPTTRRADDSVAALEAGRPVLTGKPAADSADAADHITEAAEEAGLVAATTTPHRFDGRIREAHQRVASGDVGEVLRARTSVYHGAAGAEGIEANDGLAPGEAGPAYTMGFYTADMLRWFVDDATPTRVAGELENANTPHMDHPDLGSSTIRFDDGTVGTMTITMANDYGPGYGWELEVIGTEGTVRTDHSGHEGRHWGADGVEAFGRSLDPVLDRQFDAFAEAAASGAGPDSVPPGPAAAREGIALCDAWVSAADSGGVVDY